MERATVDMIQSFMFLMLVALNGFIVWDNLRMAKRNAKRMEECFALFDDAMKLVIAAAGINVVARHEGTDGTVQMQTDENRVVTIDIKDAGAVPPKGKLN